MITIDRDELYKEVWSTPGLTLAKKYGISDVALAKACKRHDIPRPPRGHWAKLAHGKEPPQIPLPPLTDPRLKEVRFYGGEPGARVFFDPDLESLAERPLRAAATTVPERLSSPHPLIVVTQEYRKAADAGKATDRERARALSVYVSRGTLPRALRIMDTLIKGWESVGGAVTVDRHMHDATKHATYFAVGEDQVAVELEEKQERTPAKSGWGYDHHYTGQLVLRLEHAWDAKLRGTWADGKRQRVEELIDSIITGLLRRIDHEKQDRLDHEISARQSNRAKQRRATAERHVAEEQKRREQLKVEVDRWHEAERIRHYLSVLDTEVGLGNLKPHNEEAFRCWLKWAFWYADHIDPLIRAEPLPEDVEPPTNTPLEKLEWTRHTRPILERLGVGDTDALHALHEDEIRAAEGDGRRGAWDEVCRVLEGLGYDMTGRRYWLH